jgi:hypothetical protein
MPGKADTVAVRLPMLRFGKLLGRCLRVIGSIDVFALICDPMIAAPTLKW